MRRINDCEVRAEAENLHAVSEKIIGYLTENPDKIYAARQFIDYYRETAAKLLSRYDGLEATGIFTDDIVRRRADTLEALRTLNTAFAKQYEKLLSGYLGGEKTGLSEDEEIADYIKKNYHLKFDYSRAGSLDMVTADPDGRDYLFPSSRTALQYYDSVHGSVVAEKIVFNTPIVLYSHKMVADALTEQEIVSQNDDVYYADMVKLTELILAEKQWSDIGLPQLYGNVFVDTTDPARSNSGNMFAALLANSLNSVKTVDDESIYHVLPDLKKIFARTGFVETSSSDLFNQFLRMGVGAKPIIAGYESQLLEYAAEKPDDYAKIKDDIVVIFPAPTVWSAHVYIAIDEDGEAGIEALTDPEIQRLAWEKHGFRTSSNGSISGKMNVGGIPGSITSVMNVPTYSVMKQIIDELS